MRSQITFWGSATAIWCLSPALNWPYVQTLIGISKVDHIYLLALVLAVLALGALVSSAGFAFAEITVAKAAGFLAALISFSVAEYAYWSFSYDLTNKAMLLRQQVGIDIGICFVALSLLSAWNSASDPIESRSYVRFLRQIMVLCASGAAFWLILLSLRYVLSSSEVYYAIDCAMFAVLLLTGAFVLALIVSLIFQRRGNFAARPNNVEPI